MAKAFRLGDYIKAEPGEVSNLDTEKIEYLDLDLIDPDPENFYSLAGIDDLAENIELVGLLDPLRVRPAGGRYIVVSGHRRRAALMLLRDGGNEKYKTVPCIVQRGDASDKLQRLRLIFANSHTRVLSGEELARQSDEVLKILTELKAQGVELPGRMRDHVAEALNVSASKLARVQAIRRNLIPELLDEYDAGRVNESVAYRISQEAGETQEKLARSLGPEVRKITAYTLERILSRLQPAPALVLPEVEAEPLTDHERMVGALAMELAARGIEGGEMPKTMVGASSSEARDGNTGEQPESHENWVDRLRRQKRDAEDARCLEMWRRCGIQRRRVGISIQDAYQCDPGSEKRLQAMEDGREIFFDVFEECSMTDADMPGLADRLFCSLDYIFGRTEIPEMAETFLNNLQTATLEEAAPHWNEGDPPEIGYYAARLEFFGKPIASPRVLWWDEGVWYNAVGDDIRQHKIDSRIRVVGWWPLPRRDA